MNAQKQNEDALPQKFKIGKWECSPFSLHTAILLEKIDSPFMQVKIDPETKLPVQVVPNLTQIAEAMYVILHWDDPRIHEVLADPIRFSNEVGNLAGQITMRDFAVITAQLNDMMAKLNQTVTESGIPTGDEKKDVTGSSA